MKTKILALLATLLLALATAGPARPSSRDDDILKFQVNNKIFRIETEVQQRQFHILLRGAEERNLSAEMGGANLFPVVGLRGDRFLISWIHYERGRVDLAYFDSWEKKSRLAPLPGFHFISPPKIIFNSQGYPLFFFKGNNSDNDDLFIFEKKSGRLINLTETPDHEKIFSIQREQSPLLIETETLWHRYLYQVEMDSLEHQLIKKEIIDRDMDIPTPAWDSVSLNSIIAFGDSITCGEMTMNNLEGELHPELAYLTKVQEMLEEYGQTYIINLGKTATNTYQGVERMDEAFSPNPAYYCLILYGTNDVGWALFSPASSAENLEWICLNARNKFGMIPIISTIPPAKFWEPGIQVFKEETEALNARIKELAKRNDIACIDTYTAFFQCQEGWEACLDDGKGLHPSPLGHEIMAGLFKPEVLKIKPFAPQNITLVSSDPNRITIQWPGNMEFDFHQYRIEFGYYPDRLDRITHSESSYFSFLDFPFDISVHSGIYFRMQAVDQDGNASGFSPVLHFEFQ